MAALESFDSFDAEEELKIYEKDKEKDRDGGVSTAPPPLSLTMFRKHDKDNNGYISLDEFQLMLHEHGLMLSDDEFELALATFDKNGSGTVTYDEFLAWKMTSSFEKLSLDCDTITRRKHFLEMFKSVDKDRKGMLDKIQFWDLYEQLTAAGLVGEKDVMEVFTEMDENGDDFIEFCELVHWMEIEFKILGFL